MGQSCGHSSLDHSELLFRGVQNCTRRSSPSGNGIAAPEMRNQFDADIDGCSIATGSFAISRRRFSGCSEAYTDRQKIGQGVSATVFVAEAGANDLVSRARGAVTDAATMCYAGGIGSITKRRVAIKRFKRAGAESYALELDALLRVGVHPNVLRLLESLHNGVDDDVLIYEYCDGPTVWSVFKSFHKQGSSMPRVFVGRLLRQLLLALEHVHTCGIEHQDVKPENMLLHDVKLKEQRAELKLGDFGWATLGPWKTLRKMPRDGIGSMWYAAPEMNPPLAGQDGSQSTRASVSTRASETEASGDDDRPVSVGRSDMWGAGVVTYLLSVGHNPFAAAALKDKQKEQELMLMVSEARFDKNAERWKSTPVNLQQFVTECLQVDPHARPSATDPLRQVQLFTSIGRSVDFESRAYDRDANERQHAWSRLDSFQRLAWLAMARAVGEPELRADVVGAALKAALAATSETTAATIVKDAYHYELAQIISFLSASAVLREPDILDDLLRLAFNYLDVDGDGSLNAVDLASHLATSSGASVLKERNAIGMPGGSRNDTIMSWITRWKDDNADAMMGLQPSSFRAALGLPRFEQALADSYLDCGRGGAGRPGKTVVPAQLEYEVA